MNTWHSVNRRLHFDPKKRLLQRDQKTWPFPYQFLNSLLGSSNSEVFRSLS
ncbi:hypothetical protein EV06_1387 [Prochlorococcus sp. MIT 0602]|nr:hypothetical protein EV06_1387 [Prochlorococcus sp. MIT 0602]